MVFEEDLKTEHENKCICLFALGVVQTWCDAERGGNGGWGYDGCLKMELSHGQRKKRKSKHIIELSLNV